MGAGREEARRGVKGKNREGKRGKKGWGWKVRRKCVERREEKKEKWKVKRD